MALTSPHLLQQSWPSSGCGGGIRGAGACSSPIPSSSVCLSTPARRKVWVSAVALDAASPPASVSGVRWGFSKLQGMRSEMEDDLVVRTEGLGGFSFAAVFDGHAGFSSVEYLRDELYKECLASLQGGLLLNGRNFGAIKDALQKAFEDVDSKLLVWLEETRNEDESGSTATVIFLQNDFLVISHVGDSCVALSRRGKAEALTNPHRPFGNNKVSLAEVKRIRAAGGWISDGRICGEIAVSRAFGDIRFKTKKNEILDDGVKEGRLSEKFVSRVQFKGDLVVSTPDIYQVDIGSDVEFVVLASDGLWDYMKSSEVIDFVRNELRQHGDAQMACEALAHAALDRRSEDNISIVIADMGRTDWLNLPVQRTNIVYELSQAFATIGIVSLGIWISSNMSM